LNVELRIPGRLFSALYEHLFQVDLDEHAAVLLCGVSERAERLILLGQSLHLVTEQDFVPGEFGYRQTSADFVASLASRASDLGLAYVALHSHPTSKTRVGLSPDDRKGHGRLFPHLVDLIARPVVGIALGEVSAAGEVFHPNGAVMQLDEVRVIGDALTILRPNPVHETRAEDRYSRQARLFGDRGQSILSELHVGVIGAGGGGSMLVEQLTHLGIGQMTVVDFDRVEKSNLSRIVGANDNDVRLRRRKVSVAARHARQIDRRVNVSSICGDIRDEYTVDKLLDCDFLFLASDTMTSRVVVNAIAHRFLIPVIQIGAKVERAGDELEIYTAVRPVFPDHGCLDCAGVIDPMQLQREGLSDEDKAAQNYLGLPEIIDPSVISLNGISASLAVTTFFLWATGQSRRETLDHLLFFPVSGDSLSVTVPRRVDCRISGDPGVVGLGGSALDLPVRRGHGSSG
jgi:hypothetical protein